jgi:hypothetical protein
MVVLKSLYKGLYIINNSMKRPICSACNYNPCAINYKRNEKTYFRSRCLSCINRGRKKKPPTPRWLSKGYNKKRTCDVCSFQCKHGSQIKVHHIDGNLNNAELLNLRSVCLNCSAILQKQDSSWKPGDISPDV